MKMELWTVILVAVFMCFAIPYSYKTEVAQRQQIESQKTEQILLAGCENALINTEISNQSIFDTKTKREKAVKAFFDTVDRSYAAFSQNSKENLQLKIPCLVMVDWDGLYIYYGDISNVEENVLDAAGNVAKHNIDKYQGIYSQKISWSDHGYQNFNKRGGGTLQVEYLITYRLDDWVDVYIWGNGLGAGSNHFEGKLIGEDSIIPQIEQRIWQVVDPEEAKKGLDNADHTYLPIGSTGFLSDLGGADEVSIRKKEIILDSIEENVNYFLNTHNNTSNNKHMFQYNWIMPRYGAYIDNDDTIKDDIDTDMSIENSTQGRMLETPAFFAFLQGKQTDENTDLINIYGLTATDLQKEDLYFVTKAFAKKQGSSSKEKVYVFHKLYKDGSHTEYSDCYYNIGTIFKTDGTCEEGNNIIFIGTFDDCINMGAYPHDESEGISLLTTGSDGKLNEKNWTIVDYTADDNVIINSTGSSAYYCDPCIH